LKLRVFEKPTLTRIKTNAIEFKALHGIPYVLGAIDGSHILIIAPPNDLASYYYQKGFYSILLQEVVDAKRNFWDYDFRWVGRNHDWALFQKTDIGKRTTRGAFMFYKLIGDVAHLMHPWFQSPFKGKKNGVFEEKVHWILLNKTNMPFRHLSNIVTVNNLCIIHGDVFDMDWAKGAKMEMQTYTNGKFRDFQNNTMFHIAFNVIKQMKGLQISIMIIEDVANNILDSNNDKVMNGGPQNYIYI
jgi:hypothetical protein